MQCGSDGQLYMEKEELELENKPEGGRVTFTTWKHYRKDSPLMEAGLLGPVRLIPAMKIMLK